MFKLRDDITVKFLEDAVELYGYYQAKLEELNPRQLDLIQLLVQGVPSEHYDEYMKSPIFSAFMEKNLLIEVEDTEDGRIDRNHRWMAHFGFREETTYFDKKIMILGCGGTGSIIADHLARMGFNSFVLVDYAELNIEDLNRQLPYTVSMVGQKKTTALKTHLRENFSTADITTIDKNLSEDIAQEFIDSAPDFIINCADEPAYRIRIIATELSRKLNCPILFGSVGIEDYLLGPLLVGENEKSEFQIYVRTQYDFFKDCSETVTGSNCLLNTKASVDIAMECFLYLSQIKAPISLRRSWVFDPFARTKKKEKEFSAV